MIQLCERGLEGPRRFAIQGDANNYYTRSVIISDPVQTNQTQKSNFKAEFSFPFNRNHASDGPLND